MTFPWHIYPEAEFENIGVHFLAFEGTGSLSVPDHIAMDCTYFSTTNEEATAAAHELGHVCTGSFYNVYATVDSRQKRENKADRYAIHRYIDGDILRAVIGDGLPDYEYLAEYFGFTPAFMQKAVCYYVHGNLDVEHYCP